MFKDYYFCAKISNVYKCQTNKNELDDCNLGFKIKKINLNF